RYGSDSLIDGLKLAVGAAPHFSSYLDDLDPESVTDIFGEYQARHAAQPEELHAFVEQASNEVEHEFSSHPALQTRIANLPQLPSGSDASTDTIVDELHEEYVTLARALTAELRHQGRRG
ncbi:MAG: hypothetical protein MJA30_18360, partial [Cytophagales bacterium]|nr:hypothetical protein [Cytophagales bacterium]